MAGLVRGSTGSGAPGWFAATELISDKNTVLPVIEPTGMVGPPVA